MRAGPSFARGYGGQAAHAPLDKTSLPLTPGMPPSGNRLMIVELRLMIVEVKSWRSVTYVLTLTPISKIKNQKSKFNTQFYYPQRGLTATAQGKRGTRAALGNAYVNQPRPERVPLIPDTG